MSSSMDNFPVIHPRPLPVGSLHHRNSLSHSDSSCSSLDLAAASPLAHKTAKRDKDGSASAVEDEEDVSFQLDRPSHKRDRSDEMKALGLGWPSRFTTRPVDFGKDTALPHHEKAASKIARHSDGESGKSSPPPAYPLAPMLKDESNIDSVHTPPTQDIEHGCAAGLSQEDAVESMLDFPHSTITRRRRAVEAAATAFGLQLDLSPETDRASVQSGSSETGQRDIEHQIGELKRQLDARDKDLALTARMAQAILRRHEELVAALPVDIKSLIPELNSISDLDVSFMSPPPLTNRKSSSPRFVAHPNLPSPSRSRSPKKTRAHDAASPANSLDLQIGTSMPKDADHRRTKSAYTDLVFAEIRQQETDDRLAKMEQELADARDSEEAQRKNAARLSRDFHKLQRDYDRLEAQAVQAASDSSSNTTSSPQVLSGDKKTPRRPRRQSLSRHQASKPPFPRDIDLVEADCGKSGLGLGFHWGSSRYLQSPPEASSSAWQSPRTDKDSSAPLSPYTAKPERPTVLRLRRIRAAQSQAGGSGRLSSLDGVASTPADERPDSPACPPAPRIGTLATPVTNSSTPREPRVASSRSDFAIPSNCSLFSPSQRNASMDSHRSTIATGPSAPSSTITPRGRQPRVIRTSSILVRPAAGRTWMKDYLTASVRRRTQARQRDLQAEEVDDSSETIGNTFDDDCGMSSIKLAGPDEMSKGKSQASGEEGDDEAIEEESLALTLAHSGLASPSHLIRRNRSSSKVSRQSPSPRRLLSNDLDRRRQIKWADDDRSIDRETRSRRLLPKSPSPQRLSPDISEELETPSSRRTSRLKPSSNRSLRISEQRSHPYLRPLALPLAQGLRTALPETGPAILRHRRPIMPGRPHSDTAVLGHRRRISSPGRELMLQIELRQREERHRRRRLRRTLPEDECGGESSVLSMPSRIINDLIVFLGLVLEWMEVTLVIVYRVFVQARNGQRPNGGQRLWARRKRYYF